MALSRSLSQLFSRPTTRAQSRRSPGKARRNRLDGSAMVLESLERRAMLAIDATFAAGVLTIDYNQPDAGGLITTTNQNAVLEIEELGPSPQTVRVNLFRSSNPNADAYLGVTKIIVNVPNFDMLGVNNNSLTIKGLESPEDRIIMAGSGRVVAGRWYDQLPEPDQNQILFEITGVDNLTLTAGGTINVSGAFTNDTDDASITVIGTSLETDDNRTEYPNQHTATIVLGENTPEQNPDLPAARLFSNSINVIGGSIEINADIEAAGEVSLKVSDLSPEATNLVLPYDITVLRNPRTGNPGRLDLISPRNVVQQGTSVITASVVNVVADDTFGPVATAVVDLSSPRNDFDTISIQTGTALERSTGSVAIRDIDELVIRSNGLLSTTGLFTVHAGGLLTIDTPIFAGGLKAYSDFGILSTDRGSLTIGDGGIDLTAKAVAANATGDITLNGRVEIGDFDLPAVIINNAIRADGIVSVAGGFFAPQAGVTMVEGFQGIVIASPVQVGNTFLNETSTAYVVTDADLTLVSSNGFVDILDFSGNSAIPQAVQVTNMLAIDAFGDIFIDGLVFAGTRYGNLLDLTETDALPNISIRGQADITIGTTGRLETSSYETNADTHVNPLVGAITISDASQFTNFGRINADGAVEINVKGDVYLTGSVTARESITVETDLGIIDVQGAVETTGFSYVTTPPQPLLGRRTPTISLSAPSGSITTSLLGTMSAGSLLGAEDPIRGEIRLYAQQDISIGADIDTDGAVIAESKLGGFNLEALLRAGNEQRVELQAAAGITEFEFGRIQTALLDATITEGVVAADIVLPALGNRVLALQARNFTPGGSVELFTDSILDIQRIETRGDVEITATGTVGITGLAQSLGGSLEIASQGGGLNVQSTILAPQGGVTLSATGQIVQRGGNVVTIFLLSGGRDYSFANVTLDPPPGAGDVALATAVITPYPRPPFGTGDGISGFISDIIILDGGWGYPSATRVGVTIDGDGEGATAVAETSIVTSSIEARDNIVLRAGDGVTLVSAVRSAAGKIDLSATLGEISVQSITAGSDVEVTAERGEITLVTVSAQGDVTLTADQGVTVNDSLNSFAGNVTIMTTNGDLEFNTDLLTGPGLEAIIYTAAGDVSLTSVNGRILTPYTINSQGDVLLTSFNTLELTNEITSQAGDIRAWSTSGRIDITANLVAEQGSISLQAQTSFQQDTLTGVRYIELLSGGPVLDEPPVVTVTVAPPAAAGGRAATAAAIIQRRSLQAGFGNNINNVVEYEYFIQSIVVLDAGRGYEVGENPLVTVTGVAGVVARAFGPNAVQMVTAQGDITLDVGENVLLVNKWQSVAGDILIKSKTGDLDLSTPAQLVHAVAGSVTLETLAGGIEYQRIIAAKDIILRSHETLTINNQLTTDGGDVTLASTGNNVALTANVLAADRLAISAKTGIAQTGGVVKATDLYAENLTPADITLNASGNDVERFAAKNVGNVTFNDANDFRVGLKTSGTMGVEVTGANVNLTAAGTIRAVAGIQASKLSMVADTIELVTTNATDNPNAAFSGSFRDMIALSNANTDRTSEHEFVFDEPGYSVSEVNVQAALPALTRRATIDGSTATGGRLGIRGTAGVASGVRFGAGSNGSQLTTAALYGFSGGSAFVIESSGNTVSDLWFGLRADGSAPALNQANRVGLNVTGSGAFGNVIGSALEFDPLTANRFAGHTDAAIVVQRGASNSLVAGNLVGVEGRAANRTGIRIDGASGTRIGTPDQVTGDLTPTPSNRIVGNTHYGIEVRNVRGATTLIENNVVSGNATATGSGSHGIGVLNSAFVQIGGTSELSRNQVFSNLGGSGIHLSGSTNIRIVGNAIGTDGFHLSANGHTNDYDANRPDLGNGIHGIHVFGRSRDVLIDANRIVDNAGSGVAIASGSSAVNLTNNEIGVWVHPVTGNVHAAGNDADGVTITAANGNTIGAGNRIGFNAGSGVRIENSVAAGLATGNRVTGAELFGNLGHGVHLTGSSRQTIGGIGTQAGNVVMQNALDGVRIETDPRIRASAAPQGNVVAGNFVGTNSNEEIDRGWGNRNGISVMNGVDTVLSGNVVMNNRASGIEVSGGSGNTVGGQVETAGNFVGYNLGDGIFIHDQASTNLPVGVVGTTITNGGAGYSASRTTVIFTAPAASGGVAARGVAIISAAGRVTGIQLTSKGSGYVASEPVTVTIFDPQATVTATATVSLGTVEAVSQVTRGHVVSGNEIEANNGIGIYVKGDRTTEIQIGQDFDSRTGRGLPNKLSFHDVGVLVEAARRVSLQGNTFADNAVPAMMMNGANAIPGAQLINVIDLKSVAWGRGQTRVTGTVVNGGAFHEYWVDVYATPYYDMSGSTGHQMRTFLGRSLVTTDANGRAAISLTVSESMGLGDHVSVMLTSNRHEDGATVGVWHSLLAHGVDLTASPTTNTTPTTSSGSTSTTGRGPVPVR
jgi:parallel beta-helix repeat protein